MKERYTWGLLSRARDAAALVYRDTAGRAKLLKAAVRRDDYFDIPFDEVLAVNAEPTVLPEPLLRSKVS